MSSLLLPPTPAPRPPLALDAETERTAVGLLRHLEWQSGSFSLVFLFADLGPSLQLADWLDERLVLQGQGLQRFDAKDSFVRQADAAVEALLATCGQWAQQSGAVWYAVQRHPADAAWNRARLAFLARLNERRALVERGLPRPLVLVLPVASKADARAIAPDLWHKRALASTLATLAPSSGEEIGLVRAGGSERAAQAASTLGPAPLQALQEWQRLLAAPEQVPALPTGWAAVGELLQAGRPADAEELALQVVSLARARAAAGDAPEALRDLSVSLDNVGRVAQAQGDWAQAEAAYRESLGLSRQLLERLGGTPEALEDLAISLLNLSRLPSAPPEHRLEAVQIYEELAKRFPSVASYRERLAALRGDNTQPLEHSNP